MSTDFTTTIDIRNTPPLKRQQLLFKRFDILQRGQSFELVTDHDPKRLHDLLQIRSGDGVTWNFLEAGPVVWRVQVGKSAVASGSCCSGGACCG